uniref:Granulins domain-containing protein n=1 Tax=Hippocampus comes TaxID=109280 RepID=A0A3Q2ZLL6_HIPCM
MLRLSVWLALGAFVSCNIPCPDETVCSDHTTCCQTEQGYSCCGYPNVSSNSNLKCCTLGFFILYFL